jgi:hypothetical protein
MRNAKARLLAGTQAGLTRGLAVASAVETIMDIAAPSAPTVTKRTAAIVSGVACCLFTCCYKAMDDVAPTPALPHPAAEPAPLPPITQGIWHKFDDVEEKKPTSGIRFR